MILLLGATGYVGQAFSTEIRRRGLPFIPMTRRAIDYTDFFILFDYVRKVRPQFVINAAGYSPIPNVDVCEQEREEVLYANVILPQTIARVCLMTNTPWGHVSSGSIYSGAKVVTPGGTRVERSLNRPEFRKLWAENADAILGFTEWDEPNFSFWQPSYNFYSGTKALAERSIRNVGQNYIWRPRMFFNERDEERNLLTKLQHYRMIYDSIHSLSHLEEFVRACLDLWEQSAPYGIYNVVNPGAVTILRIMEMIREILHPDLKVECWKDDDAFYGVEGRSPRSSCILDTSKLRLFGIKMRPVEDALADALEHWQRPVPSPMFAAARHA